ncbi:MAG: two-component system response regulator [Verrucomicrobia bacterium]|nr:MAG: two-component system response regulator [Verrucomicrobiota bacterium]
MEPKKPILLVDDSETDLDLIVSAFQKAQFKNPLQMVRNGEEAIAYLKGDAPYSDRNKFPLPGAMLLDLKMPKKNGFDVLSWWRTQSGLRRIPVIILTASMDLGDIERAFELGAHAFLVKPCDLNELTEMIRCLRDWLKINHFSPLNEWPRR